MSNPNPPPERRVWLSDIPAPKTVEVLPKNKAFIIFWTYCAELALQAEVNEEKQKLIAAHASTIAKNFSWRYYKIAVTKKSIAKYYEEAKQNAKAYNIPWDEQAMAMIIKSQVPDLETFDKLISFMESDDLPERARTVVQAVQEIAKNKSATLRYWYDDFVPGSQGSSYYPNLDPKLEQVHDATPAPVTLETMVQAKADRDLSQFDSDD